MAVSRAGVHRQRRLRRPGQFRHQHPGRGKVRLHPAVGGRLQQPDGHADPVAVRQARHRHRPQPGRALPAALSPAAGVGDVGPDGGGGHGDRPGRISRRRPRLQSAVRHPPLGGRVAHGAGDLPHFKPAGARLPAAGSGDHRHGRGHRPVLSGRDDPGQTGLEDAGVPRGRAAVCRAGERAARRRHPRGHRDAACDLPALLAHPGPHRGRTARF